MGNLLKEALKTLCGVNQWSYAVFWKTACQNPKLLIWEECYYEMALCSGHHAISGTGISETAFADYSFSSISTENHTLKPSASAQTNLLPDDKVHLLVNKMMMDNHVNVVGDGLVGRVAFTGNYQWILAENYYRENHPPEVLKEVCLQFAAGMQTVAVIPILPHGVVQFGSCLTIMENMGFVNEAVSLIIELGFLPGYSTPVELPPESDTMNASSFIADNVSYVGCSTQAPAFHSQIPRRLVGEIQNDYQEEAKTAQEMKLNFSFRNVFTNGEAKAEVIPNSVSWMSQHSSQQSPRFTNYSSSCSSSALNHASNMKPMLASEIIASLHAEEQNVTLVHDIPLTQHTEKLIIAELIPGFVEDDKKQKPEGQCHPFDNTDYHDACFQPQSRDDLFDMLGADFKGKWFSSCSNESAANMHSWSNKSPSKYNMASSEIYSSCSDSGAFSLTGTDHLLDAVVSNRCSSAKQSSKDKVSCRTTLNDTRSSVYDPWIEIGHKSRQTNSLVTGCSEKPHQTSKTNRKRLKPGENPRPRPKDRQMIQDRVKELREIVPNGAKCSMDVLFEHTIKHMLFLQSVMKHADKLKQNADSKIISKDGGLLLKDNCGGATWAYEVGPESMVCPIVVEELNQPHQMLVEMLCDERGMFLEIADVMRGMGLTILRGLMETRNDRIWARFSVEANRKVTRMEIFLSLVRLLDQPQPNSTDKVPL